MSLLKKLQSQYGEWVHDSLHNADVYHVNKPQLLIQASGYLKYCHALKDAKTVLFRGQRSLYNCSLKPSLYRHASSISTCNKRNRYIKEYLGMIGKQGKVLKQVPNYAWEPLLQHYGISTKWIDLIDNVWIALWFATHDVYATGKQKQYFHFEQRIPRTKDDFAYILLFEVETRLSDPYRPGLYSGKRSEMVDLRIAAPSLFLRPHSQHALLARGKGPGGAMVSDYWPMVVGVIRINLQDALSWLGQGNLLTTNVLFPSPVYDFGYRDLLHYAPSPPYRELGTISYIGS
jgi:hypothetical protein